MRIEYRDFQQYRALEAFVSSLSRKTLINIETIKWSDGSEAYRVWLVI